MNHNVDDARHGAEVDNTVVGFVLSITHEVPQR